MQRIVKGVLYAYLFFVFIHPDSFANIYSGFGITKCPSIRPSVRGPETHVPVYSYQHIYDTYKVTSMLNITEALQ